MDNGNSHHQSKKILIVDDDERLRAIHTAVFQESGFQVIAARDGQEAWEFLQGGAAPDIILTGIMMPRLDGFDLFLKVSTDEKFLRIPVVIISHRGLPEDFKKAQELGVADFVMQNTTPPSEIVRRCRVILGEVKKFKILCVTDRLDGKLFVNFLYRIRNFQNSSPRDREVILELEAEKTPGVFKITIAN